MINQPGGFWRIVLALIVLLVVLAAVDKANPRAGTVLVVILLLGVAVSQRQGLDRLWAFVEKNIK